MRWMVYLLEEKGKKRWILFDGPLFCSPFFPASPLHSLSQPQPNSMAQEECCHSLSVVAIFVVAVVLSSIRTHGWMVKASIPTTKMGITLACFANGKLDTHTPFFMQVWAG